ncbi:hypothetical protein [Methyloterricola oryzae]|uniref:hypothetical protein n=1 Tax=Methyloterricola oryzae TaxID=1495050 RepID=UPI0005EBA406|nr:hypothetical protein [Methyloterricola oryzae]
MSEKVVPLLPENGVPDGEAIAEKLSDAAIPGYAAEFDPDEAESAGAFVEDALTEDDAIESATDLPDED